MSSGKTNNYNFPYPFSTDPVDVSGDIEQLAKSIDTFLAGNVSDQSAANVLYVSKSGNDNNGGTSLSDAFLTIAAALANAVSGTTVFIKSGDYTENNPVTIPAGVSLVGDNLRTVTVRPGNPTSDIFYVNNKCYVTGITFRDHLSPAAAIAFNPNGSAGNIFTSPYIQNCSSITTTGKGMYVDGSVVGGQRSMVLDSYTQFNQGGIGVHIDNDGYAQLVSIFTICCDVGVLCTNGGYCSITNSNSSFGTYGLKADGVGPVKYSGATNRVDQTGNTFVIDGLSTRPAVGNVVTFDEGVTFYTIASSTALSNTQTTITTIEEVKTVIPIDTSADFHARSFISTSGHTFEYVGSGNILAQALPEGGGVPVQENEIVEVNGGQVFYTSTDQWGDFRIGNDLTINRASGTIAGRTFDKSLFAILTPYILAIEG